MNGLPHIQSKEEIRRLLKQFDERTIDERVDRRYQLKTPWIFDGPHQLVSDYLGEAMECYIWGFYRGCILLFGASLEIALKKVLNVDEKFDGLIEIAHAKGYFTKEDKQKAHDIRKLRNEYVHVNTKKTSKRAVDLGVKMEKQMIELTEEGLTSISDGELVTEPGDEFGELIFTSVITPDLALEKILDTYSLVTKLSKKQKSQS